jgi:serine/threonine protein kinase
MSENRHHSMSIEAGTKLGSYEILALIGAGGMGEVYRARDFRLDRTVAIKVLPSHLAQRPDLRERLEREARAVSSLNHPHICTLFDIGRHEGVDFLVMEHLEGETLEARLEKGPLPLDQALRYAIAIADALAAAHRAGITHRDLKPGNIMLPKAGPKLLDFGLAKTQPAASFSSQSGVPTRASLTGEGTILGTLQYMSPEQIEGKEADARADIFALGAMLYEMVTGRKAFGGKSQVSLIASILEHEPPPMSAMQRATPASLEHVVRRCFAKDPDLRWQSAMDIVHELRWIFESEWASTPVGLAHAARKPWSWIAVSAVSLLAAVVLLALLLSDTSPSPQVWRFPIPLPKQGQSEGLFFSFQMSPNGRFIAVSGVLEDTRGIFVRELDSWDYRVLPGTNTGSFFWSPDSAYIGFFDNRKMKKVSVSGGPAEDICELEGFFGISGSWSKDDVILFSYETGGPLLRVAASGGKPEPVTNPAQGSSHHYPAFLPDGKHFLYTQRGSSPGVYVASGAGTRTRQVGLIS